MNIFWFNPRTKSIFVPEEKLDIRGIKSFDEAQSLMETFDPSQWEYYVQSKTGKTYPHSTLEEAEQDALARCTKTTTYVVYHKGKPVTAFVNKKRLPMYQNVFYKNIFTKPDYDPFKYERFDRRSKFNAKRITCGWVWTKVDRTDDRVRIKNRYRQLFLTKTGKHLSKFVDSSVTIHKNGRIFVHRNGKVYHDYEDFHTCAEAVDVVRDILVEFKPELAFLLNHFEWYHLSGLLNAYSHPNYHYVIDTFKGTVEPRCTDLSIKWLYKYFPREVTDESKLVTMLAKKLKVPTAKTFKKMYLEDISNMALVRQIMDCGITNPDNIRKVPCLGRMLQHECGDDTIKKFFKYLVNTKGEQWVTNAIVKEGTSDFVDSCGMATSHEREIIDFIVKGSSNAAQIHDTFVSISNRARIYNKEIPYTKEERENLERKYGDLEFSLPADTKTLAIIGATMGICVGGYAGSAVSKHCTIVQLKQGEKYIACIELNGNAIVQIKAKFNNMVQLEYKPAIDRWIVECKLNPRTSDYRRIGERWDRHCNYAAVRPEDFIDHQNRDRFEIIKATARENEEKNYWIGDNGDIYCLPNNRRRHVEEPFYNPWNEFEVPFNAVETDELPI